MSHLEFDFKLARNIYTVHVGCPNRSRSVMARTRARNLSPSNSHLPPHLTSFVSANAAKTVLSVTILIKDFKTLTFDFSIALLLFTSNEYWKMLLLLIFWSFSLNNIIIKLLTTCTTEIEWMKAYSVSAQRRFRRSAMRERWLPWP